MKNAQKRINEIILAGDDVQEKIRGAFYRMRNKDSKYHIANESYNRRLISDYTYIELMGEIGRRGEFEAYALEKIKGTPLKREEEERINKIFRKLGENERHLEYYKEKKTEFDYIRYYKVEKIGHMTALVNAINELMSGTRKK